MKYKFFSIAIISIFAVAALTGCLDTWHPEPPNKIPNELLEDGMILGLDYKAKSIGKDLLGNYVTSYLLKHSYQEALGILNQKFGQSYSAAMLQIDTPLTRASDWVILQDTSNDYRLISKSNGKVGVAWGKN